MARKQVWARADSSSSQTVFISLEDGKHPFICLHGIEIENSAQKEKKEKTDLILVLPLSLFKKIIKSGKRELRKLENSLS